MRAAGSMANNRLMIIAAILVAAIVVVAGVFLLLPDNDDKESKDGGSDDGGMTIGLFPALELKPGLTVSYKGNGQNITDTYTESFELMETNTLVSITDGKLCLKMVDEQTIIGTERVSDLFDILLFNITDSLQYPAGLTINEATPGTVYEINGEYDYGYHTYAFDNVRITLSPSCDLTAFEGSISCRTHDEDSNYVYDRLETSTVIFRDGLPFREYTAVIHETMDFEDEDSRAQLFFNREQYQAIITETKTVNPEISMGTYEAAEYHLDGELDRGESRSMIFRNSTYYVSNDVTLKAHNEITYVESGIEFRTRTIDYELLEVKYV